jgi:hypothetical protein
MKNKIILYGIATVLEHKPVRMVLRTSNNFLLIDRPEWLDDNDDVKIVIEKIGGEKIGGRVWRI